MRGYDFRNGFAKVVKILDRSIQNSQLSPYTEKPLKKCLISASTLAGFISKDGRLPTYTLPCDVA
jgi:hypothetical protein